MKAPSSFLVRSALFAGVGLLLTSTPLRAEDSDGDTKPGFFHRLGNSIFKGTRKLEKSDAAPDVPTGDSENLSPAKPHPAKPAPVAKKPVPTTPPTARTDNSSPFITDGSVVTKDKDKDYPSSATDKKHLAPASKTATDDTQTNTATSPGTAKDAAAPSDGKDFPTATRAKKPGFVKSPYPPYHELDATGMLTGTLARDPTSGKIFRVP